MAVGEIFLGAFLQLLLDRLTPREILNYFGLLKGVDKKLKKWSDNLSAIVAVLNDAEEKQLTDPGVKLWLDDLRDLAYDVEDVLDKFATKILKRQIEGRDQANTSKKVRSSFSKLKLNFVMNSEIKKITERLQEISERKDNFGLKGTGTSSKAWSRPPTSGVLGGLTIVGRDGDKAKILDMLSRDEHSNVNFHVVAIVGMAGLGKTTLAQFAFNNNSDVMKEFEPKVWVSVSDDFDVVRLTKAILESVTSQPVKVEEFSKMQHDLNEQLRGKKFLIVLDDIWNKSDRDLYDLWTRLQSPFSVGAQGSKIIVTTRDQNVATIMGASATEVHNLEYMSDDNCLEIFEQHAFVNNDRPPNFELLQKKIAEKCSGLPLAARTLGGLLRQKEINKWEEILNNKLWNLSAGKSDILPVLKLSYHYLPSNLKRCFAYCSIFPNDYEFGEKQLILLWMAEGLIQQPPEANRQMEDLGHDYFQELLCRSLFQKASENNSRYVKHDLVTDLAQWAAGNTCFRLEDKKGDNLQSACFRHSSFIIGDFDGVQKFEAFREVKRLRTILPLSLSNTYGCNGYLARKVIFDLLPQMQYLRVLSLNGYLVTELPNSIGKLKYLRYLDLSHTLIKSLPESTTTLYNLQTLILEDCRHLKALPRNMRNLVNLRHLNNSNVDSLKAMPPQLGRLTNLQSLPNFVVGKGSDESGIREIGSLSYLRGKLWLSRLENVIDAEDARKADLKSKEIVDELVLEWSNNTQETELVLDKLEPHRKLEKLIIMGYAGLEFSTWIGDRLFSTMVAVRLYNCENCKMLPPLGQLPLLKELYITGMAAVESVGPEFYGEGSLPFPVLETLEFEDMQHWKKWVPFAQLEGKVPENLDSLETLRIIECQELVISISNYKQIGQLRIDGCKAVVKTSGVEFELLNSLRLSNISEVRFQTGEFSKGLRKVADLEIGGCEELTSLLKNEDRVLQHLISLDRLVIEDNSSLLEKLGKEAEELLQLQILTCNLKYLRLYWCASLSKVPEGLHHLTALQDLQIIGCSSLVSFPDVGFPPSVEVIRIEECDSLLYLAKYQIPPNLRRIQIGECKTLKSLVEKEEDSSSSSSSSPISLEHLQICGCESLTSLSLRAQLFPRALKHLDIFDCGELQLITSDGLAHDNTNYCLENIHIRSCPNLNSLPEGLCHLTNLQTLKIYDCGSLVSIPSLSGEGLPSPTTTAASSLRQINIHNCNKLEMLPDMCNLNCLQYLNIDYGEGLNFTSFPPNLTSLRISGIKNCKPLWELLHRLTSLTGLSISGEDPSVVSFPPDSYREMEMEMLLPKSLTYLSIAGFPNLKKLSSKGFQSLTSLRFLRLYNCPKLAYIPEQGLPISLRQLEIIRCPLLKDKCQPGSKGRYLPKISHIPRIDIRD
ncbi:PREDICTED: LOW QUALITY PROTEIN: putative disease resistance RPP13-like protein 1 [Prunus mume]|uniref:LOW QUALITY PROTEIN: putative disease resistance RPP13-like protein 1 n=1 Tax=Prunus mume TaxID=102107 RepID=A0ABM1LRX1_PRUMU|nr:PREDICTED: LOW QUALITY PROTEIN: putative disease resistance RPP13-like protein 1 [Prunus mume]